ncbi:hypothetical protein GC173_13805 [bacterium]|nr:hypothetical protein [bacterium]
MNRRLVQVPLLLAAAISLIACGSTPPPRVYAQGDTFDPLAYDRLQEDARAQEEAAPRKISIPANSQEKGGLRIEMKLNAMSQKDLDLRPLESRAGRPIFVDLTCRNTTMNAVTVPYSSEKRFDVIVFSDSEQRNPVYVYSEGQLFAQIFQEVVLSPGANLKRVIEIPTMSLDALPKDAPRGLTRPLVPGEYWVYGTHEGTPNLAVGPMKFTVTD